MGSGAAAAGFQRDIPALTGLRFFAAFFILVAHATDWLAQFQDSEVREHLRAVSIYGMPLFFVLSGFVIHYNYGQLFSSRPLGQAVSEFAVARVARLFPLYFFMLIVSILADNFITRMSGHPDDIKAILLNYLVGTQSWFYLVLDQTLIINQLFPLSWSISTELFFYAAYIPLVFLFFRAKTVRVVSVAAIGYAIVASLIFVSSRYELNVILSVAKNNIEGFIRHDVAFAQSFYRWLFYFSPYVRVFEFIMGCLTAHAFMLVRSRPVSVREHYFGIAAVSAALAMLMVAGLLYTGAVAIEPINLYVKHLAQNFLCAPPIAVVLFCVSRYQTKFTAFLSSSILVRLGETSYSIYMVHTWTLRIFNHPTPTLNWISGIETIFRVLMAITFTLLVAYATYRLIEVPARNWLRGGFARWTAKPNRNRVRSDQLAGMQDIPVPIAEIRRASRVE
jgi:peptidoglycan/LPS O-acetylase OafA/YrhL